MGFFSNLGRTFGFGSDDPFEDAANRIAESNRGAIEGIEKGFGATQANLLPFVQAGQRGLAGLEQGSTAQGLSGRLDEIFGTDIFKGLLGERQESVGSALSAGGLTRSGTAVEKFAELPQEVGLFLENLLTGRQAGLAQQGLGAAGNLGQFQAASDINISQIKRGTGEAQSQAILGGAQAGAAGTTNLLSGLAAAAPGIGRGLGAIGDLFFSDPHLKENVHQVGNIGPLGVYKWDWIKKAQETVIGKCGAMGFMADEVYEYYPEFVGEYCGFDIIDYPGLLDKLKGENECRH